ncbi:hypothetical protein PIB30_048085 [Stylosanthes scabra]|uniref:Uncharacterized protein n=1 Tax=Stylosanthes scabra TaxID=79078 RepID=A0ABU6VFS5_9FABA|nr:hypothetical protein [Stylosanthes scabra]
MHKTNIKEVSSIEVVFQDIKGGRIQAFIPRSMFKRHGNSIQEFKMTIVTPVAEPTFPLEPFRFQNIAELLSIERIDGSQLIDVIAEVIGKEDPRELTTVLGHETKRLALKIQDLEGNTVEAVLFGGLVDQIWPHMEDGRVEPLIVVLQYFRPNRWKGDAREFRTRLIGDTTPGSVRIAQVSSQGGSTGITELRKGNAVVKTIEQVMALKEVEIVACDGTRGISLLLWDTQVSLLCGKTAEQIKMEAGLRDEEYPETLDSMMWWRLIFRIYVKDGHVKGTDNVYSVAATCDDEAIVSMNFLNDFDAETSNTFTDNGCSNEVNEDSGVISLEQKNDAGADVSMIEESVTNIKCKTPRKRSVVSVKHCVNQQQEQEADGQLSTNRFSIAPRDEICKKKFYIRAKLLFS